MHQHVRMGTWIFSSVDLTHTECLLCEQHWANFWDYKDDQYISPAHTKLLVIQTLITGIKYIQDKKKVFKYVEVYFLS